MTNPQVWVVQEGRNDYAAAEEFGEVRFITDSEFRSMPGCQQNLNVLADIKKFKSLYIAHTDYIVLSGNLMTIALLIMALDDGPDHRFLKWDGRKTAYTPFILHSNMVN